MNQSQYPLELRIGNIDAAIFDQHNQIFPYVIKIKNGILLHVDAHQDFFDGVKTYNPNYQAIEEYTRYSLGINDFVCPLVHEGAVSVVYDINPRLAGKHISKGIIKDGRILSPITTIAKGHDDIQEKEIINYEKVFIMKYLKSAERCFFDNVKIKKRLSITDIVSDLKNFNGDLVLDIELDAFYSSDDIFFEIGPVDLDENLRVQKSNKIIQQRIEYVDSFISQSPRPNLITICRAQGIEGKTQFVPPKLADELQEVVVDMLSRYFS